jgi:ketopantoate hydroxymethyltransferase
MEDAKALEEAGCFAIVLEKIPAKLAEQVAKAVEIPIIGIGAGGFKGSQTDKLRDYADKLGIVLDKENLLICGFNGYPAR